MNYIGRRQTTVAKWVAIRPLFEVCAREIGYKGGGNRWEAWWCQEAKEKQLWSTLEISQEAKMRRSAGEKFTK